MFEFTPEMRASPHFPTALAAIKTSFAGSVKYDMSNRRTSTPGTYCFMQCRQHNCTYICVRECHKPFEPCDQDFHHTDIRAIYICVYEG